MATSSRARRHAPVWFRPGEMVVVVELPPEAQPRAVHRSVRLALEQRLAGSSGGVFHPVQQRDEPIVFTAPNRPRLAFFFFNLADQESAVVKRVVTAAHADDFDSLAAIRQDGVRPVGAMPHWLALAQQSCMGGSPGSFPRPVRRADLPGSQARWRYRYTPAERSLDLRARTARLARASLVPVVVLDTVPDERTVRAQAERFGAVNGQIEEVSPLVDAAAAESGPHPQRLSQLESLPWRIVRSHRNAAVPAGDLADHGLFVASLVRGLAPLAPLRLMPVLSSHGIGDLETLLRVLASVTQTKKPADPVVINLSLGLMPHVERLLSVWYGFPRPHDPDFIQDPAMQTDGQDAGWVVANRAEAERRVDLLHAGLDRVATYLLENNCLVVAAAGNDSLRQVDEGRPRLSPRVPARYESVLGVAATGRDGSQAARYSNVGDAQELGDHVASLGGDVDDDGEPRDGIIGVHTAAYFPDARTGRPSRALPNETGWASWSGTSFTTAIVSGIAANYWATQRGKGSSPDARQVLYSLGSQTGEYAPALRTPSIEVAGRWEPVE